MYHTKLPGWVLKVRPWRPLQHPFLPKTVTFSFIRLRHSKQRVARQYVCHAPNIDSSKTPSEIQLRVQPIVVISDSRLLGSGCLRTDSWAQHFYRRTDKIKIHNVTFMRCTFCLSDKKPEVGGLGVNVKVRSPRPFHAVRVYSGSTCIPPLIPNLSTQRGEWSVNFPPRPLDPQDRAPINHCMGGRTNPRDSLEVLGDRENFSPLGTEHRSSSP